SNVFPSADVYGIYRGSWADYDNDGDLDVLVVGKVGLTSNATHLFRNDGGATFTPVATALPSATAADWGDFDNDGDLDLALVGCDWGIDGLSSRIYRNDGNGVFTNIGANLTNISPQAGGTCAWGDYDGDGDLDLFLGGMIFRLPPDTRQDPATEVYENQGHG